MSLHVDHVRAAEDYISVGQMIACGPGAIADIMPGDAIGYMLIVRNVGLVMKPALAGAVRAISRFTDFLTDPAVPVTK